MSKHKHRPTNIQLDSTIRGLIKEKKRIRREITFLQALKVKLSRLPEYYKVEAQAKVGGKTVVYITVPIEDHEEYPPINLDSIDWTHRKHPSGDTVIWKGTRYANQ